mmetsp:Transcript_9078/g.33498  ORF Transcript_9078/g.33498 Transcript_9078/m.33498 type:complete len:211 (+) Transcript_9078:1405-2037(+)
MSWIAAECPCQAQSLVDWWWGMKVNWVCFVGVRRPRESLRIRLGRSPPGGTCCPRPSLASCCGLRMHLDLHLPLQPRARRCCVMVCVDGRSRGAVWHVLVVVVMMMMPVVERAVSTEMETVGFGALARRRRPWTCACHWGLGHHHFRPTTTATLSLTPTRRRRTRRSCRCDVFWWCWTRRKWCWTRRELGHACFVLRADASIPADLCPSW